MKPGDLVKPKFLKSPVLLVLQIWEEPNGTPAFRGVLPGGRIDVYNRGGFEVISEAR